MGKLIAAQRFKEIPGDNEDDMDRFTRKKNAGTLAPRTPANSHHGLQSMHIRKVLAQDVQCLQPFLTKNRRE